MSTNHRLKKPAAMSRARLGMRLLVAALVLSALAPALVARADASFDRASAAYASERFDEAARELEALVLERGYSPGGLANLGAAYSRDGRYALAILAFERARLLSPTDPQIRAGLASAREHAGVSAPAPSAVEELAALQPARAWMTIGAAALALFCLAALAAGALRRARPAAILAALSSAAVIGACATALWVGTLSTDRAIVIGERAAMRVSPFDEADVVAALAPGELVRIEEQHGAYLRVASPDGRRGWMAGALVERVVPASR